MTTTKELEERINLTIIVATIAFVLSLICILLFGGFTLKNPCEAGFMNWTEKTFSIKVDKDVLLHPENYEFPLDYKISCESGVDVVKYYDKQVILGCLYLDEDFKCSGEGKMCIIERPSACPSNTKVWVKT